MATNRDPDKDISFLLAVVHNLTITSEFANKAIENWPTDLCPAVPVDGEDLGRGIDEIWQKWIGNDLACASTPEKKDGTCLNDAIVIDDSDEETEKPITPVSPRILPRKFRIPPAASLVIPLGAGEVLVTPKIGRSSKIVVDLGEPDHKDSTPTIDRACSATKNDAGLLTPCSLEKAGTTIKKVTKSRGTKAKLSRRKTRDVASSIEPDEKMFATPFAMASSRKRRHGINYNDVPADGVFDNSDDEDFSPEEFEDDKRIDQDFEAKYPVLKTPSKRQKKTKS
ncbi:hypothetical protein KCU95_g5874, partial [Aureobasidium melanogenum]